jgi:AcrR family transcriptional regulator
MTGVATARTSGGLGRRERHKQQTRDRILDAALQLLASRGYDETSVDAIAEAADVARQTFFNYFPSKEDVVHAWVERRRAEVRAGLQEASHQDAVTRVEQGLLAVAALYDADAVTSRPMVRHWIRCGGPLLPDADATADLLREGLERGHAAGQIRDEVDLALASHVLLDVYLGRLYHWAATGGELGPQLAPAVRLVLQALRA